MATENGIWSTGFTTNHLWCNNSQMKAVTWQNSHKSVFALLKKHQIHFLKKFKILKGLNSGKIQKLKYAIETSRSIFSGRNSLQSRAYGIKETTKYAIWTLKYLKKTIFIRRKDTTEISKHHGCSVHSWRVVFRNWLRFHCNPSITEAQRNLQKTVKYKYYHSI